MSIFAAFDVYHDIAPHSAAMNMAIDEAMLGSAASPSIYAAIHEALRTALIANGERAELEAVAAVCGSIRNSATVTDRRYNDCFAHPVRADVLLNGRKVAGAAQRRTRDGLLQQGSVQYVDLGNGLTERFAQALSANCSERKITDEVLNR